MHRSYPSRPVTRPVIRLADYAQCAVLARKKWLSFLMNTSSSSFRPCLSSCGNKLNNSTEFKAYNSATFGSAFKNLCFMGVQSTLTTLFRFGNKVCFENNKRMRGEIIGFLIIKKIKKPQPCSVLLQSSQEATRADSSSRSLEYTRLRLVFPDFYDSCSLRFLRTL